MRAELKPEEKVAAIRALSEAGKRVAMVGDGVNDAPSLAAAHIGVAMGARGSDAALEQADVVLMHDRLENFLAAFRLSQRARRVIRQNLVISLGTVVVLVTFAMLGKIPLAGRRRRPRRQHGDRGDEQPAAVVWREDQNESIVAASGRRLVLKRGVRNSERGIKLEPRYLGGYEFCFWMLSGCLIERCKPIRFGRHIMDYQQPLIQPEQVEQAILLIRGQRVMLDRDLAALYGVETKNLNKAVRRNLDRFPADFMFQLTAEEAESLRFQFGSLKRGQHFKYPAQVFTQEGVAMLSSVLRSPRAAQVNIAIMRVFVRLRETLALHKELAHKLAELERKIEGHALSASIGERAGVRCRIRHFRSHPPAHDPAGETKPRNRLSRPGSQRALPGQKQVASRRRESPGLLFERLTKLGMRLLEDAVDAGPFFVAHVGILRIGIR